MFSCGKKLGVYKPRSLFYLYYFWKKAVIYYITTVIESSSLGFLQLRCKIRGAPMNRRP